MPLSRKYSPIAHPEYGAKYCSGAASEAVAETTILSKDLFKVYCLILSLKKKRSKSSYQYFMASASVSLFTIWATVDLF